MIVYVALWSHRHGEDLSAHRTIEGAYEQRRKTAEEQWDEEFDSTVPKPKDRQKLANAYFLKMGDQMSNPEFFDIYTLTVRP